MSPKYNLYLGRAGQLAAMSIFLMRGWNVATPEVDVGDDMFVVDDKQGLFFRIQVKTSLSILRQNGYSARFRLPISQIVSPTEPSLFFVFVTGRDNQWLSQILIERQILLDLFETQKIGSLDDGYLQLYLSYKDGQVKCFGIDLTSFLNNFDDFPIIVH